MFFHANIIAQTNRTFTDNFVTAKKIISTQTSSACQSGGRSSAKTPARPASICGSASIPAAGPPFHRAAHKGISSPNYHNGRKTDFRRHIAPAYICCHHKARNAQGSRHFSAAAPPEDYRQFPTARQALAYICQPDCWRTYPTPHSAVWRCFGPTAAATSLRLLSGGIADGHIAYIRISKSIVSCSFSINPHPFT